jgi:hypothetical protein
MVNATAHPRVSSAHRLGGIGRPDWRGGERGRQLIRPTRVDGSTYVGVTPGATARALSPALAAAVGVVRR